MSDSKNNRRKTTLREALGLGLERVIECPRNTTAEAEASLSVEQNITHRSTRKNPWDPARNVKPEKSYYDLQEVLDYFASRHGFDFGYIEGDKVVIYKERKK